MHEDTARFSASGEDPSVEEQIEVLRAHSATLRARRLAVLSATFEHRAIWEELQWRRQHRGAASPPREPEGGEPPPGANPASRASGRSG